MAMLVMAINAPEMPDAYVADAARDFGAGAVTLTLDGDPHDLDALLPVLNAKYAPPGGWKDPLKVSAKKDHMRGTAMIGVEANERFPMIVDIVCPKPAHPPK
jgi:hypothetical protein